MNSVAGNPILILHTIHTGFINLYTNLVPANDFTSNKLYYCPV